MEQENIIEIRGLVKRFPIGHNQFTALSGISLSFGKAEFAGLVGPSGSGKTTLLNIVGSLDTPSEGSVIVLGQPVAGLSQQQSAALRNYHIGFIFQTFNLLPVFSVFDNVEFALLLQKRHATDRRQAVMEALEWVGLADKAKLKPTLLSGGECQRVSIARAMVKRPELVLADEPSANLDAKNSHHIIQTMKRLNRELGTTFLFATHDEKVMHYLDRIITLEDGRVAKDQWIEKGE